ncbi:hypothetical protein WB334_26110, partial [Escherichia coli]|uniref:hypothetical protein n=1 Tax=Escherichia coli TaxID=562 RepID=UPI0021584551
MKDQEKGDGPAGRPLVVTDDEVLLEELLRLGAAAGIELTCARHPTNRAQWRAASVVLIGAAEVPVAVAANWPRRAGVFAVCLGEPDAALWEQ